jgi:ABC-type transport system involved in multi-copper enzyme maturation permease subunit
LSQSAYEQRLADAEVRRDDVASAAQDCLRSHGVDPDVRTDITDEVAKACFPQRDVTADDPRFHRKNLEGLLQGVTGALAIVGWTLGASFVGAEFASRSMTTLLTWEPRRLRVFLAKVAAVLLANAVLALMTLLVFVAAMLPSLALHGGPMRADDPSTATLAGIVLRGTALAVIATGLGFSLAAIGRNTAAALGAGFAYVIILENIVGSFREGSRRWLLLGNVIVFVSGRDSGGDIPGRTVTAAAVILVVVAVTFLAGAYGTFRSRDLA